ncbi:L-alanine-DL-glutamate epimerase-like enolase superfamily enzyme [Pedobacter africanus]|uniref:L-alanine-DL-glutamate epimerase-like enolase superfamily enzyme n=1 Tax=Pedobacter africanus TaxID=151894 RepID=A0ACC6L3N2_9SPHI|nr:dipeptide epimerase [Pedobacter africanus]MDR6786035.1 L-alanine-DL-glutamate epimerase-like enolase superfamily enzyme [Pedobacter africanus]
MKLAYTAYSLELKHPFAIAKFSRTSTPIMLIRLTYENTAGYGEASMVPYMGESVETAVNFLKRVDWKRFVYPFNFGEIMAYLDSIEKGHPAIKAAIDIALNDINGKLLNKPCYTIYGADPSKMPVTSYTIGIDTPEVIREKVADAKGFKVLKIKLGRDNDKELINTIRSVSNLPLYVDANQGWTDKKQAIDMIYWLHDNGVLLIEQPMDKANLEGNAWLTARSPIPILADEAVQRLADMEGLKGAYHGINIKLMKSGGMYEGHQIILKARSLGMKVLIGCMSETSCATQAGIALAPLCDWADLDGPWLTKNNPFNAPAMADGKYQLNQLPGLGLEGIDPGLFTSF